MAKIDVPEILIVPCEECRADEIDECYFPELHPQVKEWCQENFSELKFSSCSYTNTDYSLPDGHCDYRVNELTLFCTDAEAVLFKLRWADQFAGEKLDG